jgi:membrane-bound inhibitor of C-type lysozyme
MVIFSEKPAAQERSVLYNCAATALCAKILSPGWISA